MTPTEIAKIVADYLRDRDDIAAADVIDGEDGVVGVETQGGHLFMLEVRPA